MSTSVHRSIFWGRSTTVLVGIWALAIGCSTPPETSPETSIESSTAPVDEATAAQPIAIDGSSTVYPLTDEMVKEFQFEREDEPQITVEFSGTGGGFQKFCAGETDINNASRPITTEEMALCKAAGVEYLELPVAFDALTIAVHPDNAWATEMTVEELQALWEPAAEGTITRWNQIRSDWPNEPINLYGAGQDSGTFDYFTEVIVGEPRSSRSDYTASEDDYELVRGVRNDPNSLGYFGYAYYEESQRLLQAVAIDSGKGAVMPSSETVASGEYTPLSRPLFIYVNTESLENQLALREFVDFYLKNVENLAEVVGYVPLSTETSILVLEHFETGKVGTAFAGQSEVMTIEELLQREKSY